MAISLPPPGLHLAGAVPNRPVRKVTPAPQSQPLATPRPVRASRYPIYVAHRLRYGGPLPGPEEMGFAPFPGASFAAGALPSDLAVNPRYQQCSACQRADERELLARLADGRIWVTRRGIEILCPICGYRYRDYPAVRHVADIALEQRDWGGRGYWLGPEERAHADAFHWLVRWQHNVGGCAVPVGHTITEGQVLAWTDAYGPWHVALPGVPR